METTSHIFMGYEWARKIWFASPLGVRFDEHYLGGAEFKEWLADSIDGASAAILPAIFAICYEIWSARNILCFAQVQTPIPHIINKALNSCAEYESQALSVSQIPNTLVLSNVRVAESVSIWNPPMMNFYKLNVDAAGPVDGNWGIGVIIRDYIGFVMAAGMWRIPCLNDVAVAEALALKMGMQFALDLFFLQLQAESDSTSVVAAMNSNSNINNYMGLVIQDCKSFKAQFSSFSCNHIRRYANQVAHGLAKPALNFGDRVWVEETPHCISNIISLDCSSFSVE